MTSEKLAARNYCIQGIGPYRIIPVPARRDVRSMMSGRRGEEGGEKEEGATPENLASTAGFELN